MATYTRFEQLPVWQKSRVYAAEVFSAVYRTPLQRDFKFKDQILASSGSVMDNIAEGFERNGTNEFVQHLSISKGSCGESRSQLYRAFDFKYLTEADLKHLTGLSEIISGELQNLSDYVQKSGWRGQKFANR